uniref:Amino acid permease/ SLC12A domain-containing protein n=1 Tax=Anopheles culicifacies TaxID=139723 RepID=A0A182MHY1_9DIPT
MENTPSGGVYLVNFLNVYGPGLAILFVVFVEAAGVFWFYGVENFSADIEQMLGKKPSLFWRICWKYISPTFLFCILIFSLLGYEEMLGEEYEYPEWSVAAGWALTLSSVLCIPTYVIYKFLKSPGNCEDRLRRTFKPEPLIPTAIPGQLYTGTAV